MSFPSIPYTFTNGVGNVIDATAINANFTAMVNAISDGATDINVRDATVAGTVQMDANLIVGNNIMVTGNLGVNEANPSQAIYVDGSAYIGGNIFSYPTDGGWADESGSYTISGLVPVTTYTYTHRRVGAMNMVAFDMTGVVDSTSVVVGLPSPAASNGAGFMGSCRMVMDQGSSYQNTPTMLYVPANYSDMTVSKDFAGTDFTCHSLRLFGTFMYEE